MKRALRQELAIEEDQPMLLSLSRISYEKNIKRSLMDCLIF